MVRQAGATEVHMRIASPPTTHSCFYGVDTPERDKLLAARMSVDEMARVIGVDSLAFISIDGLYRAMGETGRNPEAVQYFDARSEERRVGQERVSTCRYGWSPCL